MTDRRTAWAAKQRAGLKQLGLVRVEVWAYPEDRDAIRDFADKLREEREASAE